VLAEADRLGIRLLWLPTSAPWLNPIEKLWRKTKQGLLHHHRLADAWDDLKARVGALPDGYAHGSTDLLRTVGLWTD
jgi:transposase